MTQRIAVISDLHANALALRAALAQADAAGYDKLMILGDLLTYGCDPCEVLDLVGNAMSRKPGSIIPGNHDQLYFDLDAGDTTYFEGLPPWLRETVEWTREQIAGTNLSTAFAWEKEIVLDGIFFAHANPYAYGDWTYLNADADLDAAHEALRRRGYAIGVFGHTHRPKIMAYAGTATKGTRHELGAQRILARAIASADGALADPGSLGQPRSGDKTNSMMFIETDADTVCLELHQLDYDVAAHTARIRASDMSASTKEKLLGYFP